MQVSAVPSPLVAASAISLIVSLSHQCVVESRAGILKARRHYGACWDPHFRRYHTPDSVKYIGFTLLLLLIPYRAYVLFCQGVELSLNKDTEESMGQVVGTRLIA